MTLRRFKIKEFEIDDVLKFFGCFLRDNINKTRPTVDKYVMIIDIKNKEEGDVSINLMKQLNPILSNYFPDVLFRMYIINVGFFIKSVVKMAMSFLHPVTKKKIQIIGTSKDEIFNALKEVATED